MLGNITRTDTNRENNKSLDKSDLPFHSKVHIYKQSSKLKLELEKQCIKRKDTRERALHPIKIQGALMLMLKKS